MKQLLSLLLLFPLLANAQDWALFPYGQRSYFESDNNLVTEKTVKIAVSDSIKMEGEIVTSYFIYNDITRDWNGCDSVMQENFGFAYYYSELIPGMDSIIYENGISTLYSNAIDFDFKFYNNAQYLDTFHLLSEENEHIYLKCYFSGISDFLGVTDSVKKFRFYSDDGTTLLNDYIIELSKNYGLISFIDFNHLANYIEGSGVAFYSLIGINTDIVNIAYKIPDWQEYFPYAAGDIRIWEVNELFNWPYNYFDYNVYYQDSITEKLVYADSIAYTFDRIKKDTDAVLTYFYDLKIVYTKGGFETLLEGYPNWLVVANNPFNPGNEDNISIWWPADAFIFIEGLDTISLRKMQTGTYFLDTAACILDEQYDVVIAFNADTKSGINYSNYSVGDASTISYLKGYTINGVEYGNTDFESININEIHSNPITVFPNPASDILNIKNLSAGLYNYNIYNLQGSIVESGNMNKNTLDVHKLRSGIYTIEIKNDISTLRGSFVKL